MQGALTSARCCSTQVFANAKAGESDAAPSAPFQPGKPQEWRSHAECRQAACVNLLESAHFCVSGETTHSTPLQQTTATTEYDANAAARNTVRSGAACDLGAQERRREGVERAGRLREELGEGPVTGIEGRPAYRFAKRAFDVAFSAAVLVAFCWLFAIIAALIKADDPKGPVLFRQRRVGKGGETFQMYKFRSMCVDAEERLAELRELNEKTGPVFKMAEDPRVTRVGRWLRKLSLDELPQFINVLAGDMSVVGPRPALPSEVATYNDYQHQRLLVKPGLTCYWQTRRNRDPITFDEWVELDLWPGRCRRRGAARTTRRWRDSSAGSRMNSSTIGAGRA